MVMCLLFICTPDIKKSTISRNEIKHNECNQIKVLLQRDFKLKVLIKYTHDYGLLSTKSYYTIHVCHLPYFLQDALGYLNSFSWNEY